MNDLLALAALAVLIALRLFAMSIGWPPRAVTRVRAGNNRSGPRGIYGREL